MILRIEDFREEAQIPGLLPAAGTASPNNAVVQDRVRGFIDKYEPLFLESFFGGDSARAQELEDYSGLPPESRTDTAKNDLVEAIRRPASHYVAFHYLRHGTVSPTRIGGIVMQGENGRVVSNSSLCVLLWNQMRGMNIRIYNELLGEAFPMTEVFRIVSDTNL